MKGLDTPLLIGLLGGEPRVRTLLEKLEGEDLCTTVVNLFELEVLARSEPRRGRDRRAAAVQRLRRKLTVVGVDDRAAGIAAERAGVHPDGGTLATNWLILGALESSGCDEWFTTKEARFPDGSRTVRITVVK